MKTKVEIPKTIPLYRYQEYVKIEEPTDEDALKTLLGFSQRAVDMLSIESVENIASATLSRLEAPELIRHFKLEGINFGFIPKLDDISWGENRDIVDNLPKSETNADNLHKAMAVLYRPVTVRKNNLYQIDEYEGTAKYEELMRLMPSEVALSCLRFFFLLSRDLLRAIPNYLEKEEGTLTDSLISGEDITKYTQLLKGISGDLRTLQI